MAQKAYKTGKGKMTAGEAMKYASESTKKIWSGKNFRKMIDGNPWLETPLKAIPIEMVQEMSEDAWYNVTNLVNDLQKEDYYKDEITMGSNLDNKFFGEKSIFDPHQMLETAVLTAIATGTVNLSMEGAQGNLKPDAIAQRRNLLRHTWTAEQAAKGNLPLFLNRAKEEYAKPVNAFGSKEDKLSAIGAENIVIPADQAQNLKQYFTTQEDGSIVIDNVADANYLNFIQNATAVQEITSKYGINGQTMNAKMLHQVYDVNNMLLSTKAIDAATAMDSANAALEAVKQEMGTDVEQQTTEQLEKLKEAELAYANAKKGFDYLMQIEPGTSYSKGINDQIKEMLTSYDLATDEAKKMLGDKYNPEDTKTFEMVKNLWAVNADSNKSYKKFAYLVDAFRNMKLAKTREVQDKIANVGSENTEVFEASIDALSKSIDEDLKLDDAKFSQVFSTNISSALKTINDDLDKALNIDMMPINKYNGLVDKYKGMYEKTLQRITGIENTFGDLALQAKDLLASTDPFEQAVGQTLADGDQTRFEDITGYDEYAKKNPSKVAELQAKYVYALDYEGGVVLPQVDEAFNRKHKSTSPAKYAEKKAKRLKELQDELAAIPGLDGFMTKHIDDMADAFKRAAEMFSGDQVTQNPVNVQKQLEALAPDRALFKVAHDVALRLAHKKEFEDHASLDEQQAINKLAEESTNAENLAKLQQMENDYDTFLKASGMDSMTSIKGQHHSRAVNLSMTVDNLIHLNGLQLSGVTIPLISDVQMSALRGFTMDNNMFMRKGDYTDDELTRLEEQEHAVIQIMNNIQSHRTTIFSETNMDIILQPLQAALLKGLQPKGISVLARFTDLVGYDGTESL